MRFGSLQPLHDRAVLFTQLRQGQFGEELTERLGEDYRWDVDVPRRQLTFSGPRGWLETRCHLVASIAPGPRSLLWGWANPAGTMPGDAARTMREYGEQHHIEALTDAELPLALAADDDLETVIAHTAHEVAAVAVAITRMTPYYSAPAGAGTRVLFLVELPADTLPPLRIGPHTIAAIERMLASGAVRDHRAAIHGLADLAGWRIAWAPGHTGAVLSDPYGSRLRPQFDARAMLTNFGERAEG